MGIVLHAQAVVSKQRCSAEANGCSELHHLARNPLADITEDGDLVTVLVQMFRCELMASHPSDIGPF